MATRLSFHSQISSIMETMARSALSQVCKLVDEESSELRLGLSQLLAANSALAEKVNSLECELMIVRSDAPRLCKSYRSVGVQTVCQRDGDAHVPESPTIEGIFGKDWCMNLWKDRNPYSLERDSPLSFEGSVVTLSNQITVTEIKEEDYVEDVASSCQQEAFSTEAEHEESTAEEPELLSVGYSGSTCSLPFDQNGEPVECAGGIEEGNMQFIAINDTGEAFSTHIIPIEEEEEEEEDVQFVEESQQEPIMNAAVGPSHNEEHILIENSENSTDVDKESLDEFNMLNVEPASDPEKEKFTCQICGRTFFHKGTLTHHMKSHKANFCSICKLQLPRRSRLKSHKCVPPVPSCTSNKSCTLCGKTFANQSSLRIHFLVHTGEKPHRCSLCGKGFTQKGNLKCHLRIHTGERPFCCFKCGRSFTQKVNLNHHLMAHRNHEKSGPGAISKA